MPMTLNPTEKSVLIETSAWRTRAELEADLAPEFCREALGRAIDFLQHAGWLEAADYLGGDAGASQPIYKRTEPGTVVMRRQYRQETAVELTRPTRRLILAR